ncbi:protein MHF2 homolog [Rhododendron vialii]|uniref:protein MHF2 homolog n=1 Tax=Rhododendron vialii TaxID=182163 RepID=UPI00265F778F|nr:protein MHF2 homolog [Rhododendron vialii]
MPPGAGTSKKSRPTFADANALKLSSELLSVFVTEAVERAATIAEAEGASTIEATHLERVLPQLLLDIFKVLLVVQVCLNLVNMCLHLFRAK